MVRLDKKQNGVGRRAGTTKANIGTDEKLNV